MRLYISADMEGIANVVTFDQVAPTGFEYQAARKWMTEEVIAACEVALDEGIKEIVISDSHWNGENLLVDLLPQQVQLIRSWPRHLGMMEGIDIGDYCGAAFIGYHGGATSKRGILAHTLSGKTIADIEINGHSQSEATINATIAGHFGVPIVLVSGDAGLAEHVKESLGNVETAVVKWEGGQFTGRSLMPATAQDVIRNAMKQALDRIDSFSPHIISTPIEVVMTFSQRFMAEIFSFLPIIEQISDRKIGFKAKDVIEMSRIINFITTMPVLQFHGKL